VALAGAGQTVPHFPQLEAALEVSTHDPPQLVRVPQSPPQMPVLQTLPLGHTVAHLPQWVESELRSMQAPLQLVKPGLHTTSQTLLVQTAAPFVGTRHTVPHFPQLATSVSSFTQLLPHAE
jgi:hypothetical protein